MGQSAIWVTIWIAAAAVFGVGEMMLAGSFFLLPFAAGALSAAAISLLDLHFLVSWATFLVVSVAAFIAMRPLADRLVENAPEIEGVGANRLLGAAGVVLAPISATAGDAGLVKVGTEEWRADTRPGVALSAGSKVRVVEVQGTRLVVEPTGIDDVIL